MMKVEDGYWRSSDGVGGWGQSVVEYHQNSVRV